MAGLRLQDVLPFWWDVARPWFLGLSSRSQAWRYVAVCMFLAVVHTLMAVKVSYAQKHFSTALAEKNKPAWMSAVKEFVVIICLFAPIRSLESYAEKRMVAVWRTALTQLFISAYTANKAFFHMQLARGTEGQEAENDDGSRGSGGGDRGGAVDTHDSGGGGGGRHADAAAAAAAAVSGPGGLRSAVSSSSSSSSSSLLGHQDPHQHQLLRDGMPGRRRHSSYTGGAHPGRLKVLRTSLDREPFTPASLLAAGSKSRSNSHDAIADMRDTVPLLQQEQERHHQQAHVLAIKAAAAAAAGAGGDPAPSPLATPHKQQRVGAASSPATQLAPQPSGRGVVAGLSGALALVDNPDQRITADVGNYVQTSVGLVLLLIRKALNCAAFAGVLWSISPKLVVFLLSYALLGTCGTAAVFGAPLTRLKQRLLRLEADLRFGLVRLRENAEAIAFYGGDVREAADLSHRNQEVFAVLLWRILWLGGYEFWLVIYRYATILIPSLVLAPEYFAGLIEFGTMTQASFAFHVLEEALRLILERMEDLSSLAAETGRLAGLLAALRSADIDAGGDGTVVGFGTALQPKRGAPRRCCSCCCWPWRGGGSSSNGGGIADDVEMAHTSHRRLGSSAGNSGSVGAAVANGGGGATNGDMRGGDGGLRLSRVLRLMDGSVPGFRVEGLTASVPGRHHQPMCVCEDLTFSLAPGESLLVMGPSGCGKSSLLRVVAGLWTVGSGTVRGPGKPFFLPQKPFMPLGTLRQQLLFPTNCSKSSPSVMAYLAAQQQQQQAQQRKQQQQQSESTPLLGGLKHRSHAYAAAASSSAAAHTNDAVTGMESSGAAAAAADVCVSAGAAAAAGEDGDGGSCAGVDEQLQALLSAVNLGHLLHRFPGGLDAQVDWASVLSLGEQQRVALVRLLFHRPLLAFLDEATAALDPRSEAVAYGLIARACSCYVSVGHRPQLLDWHSHVLVAAGPPGLWAKYTAAEFRARRTAGLEA